MVYGTHDSKKEHPAAVWGDDHGHSIASEHGTERQAIGDRRSQPQNTKPPAINTATLRWDSLTGGAKALAPWRSRETILF